MGMTIMLLKNAKHIKYYGLLNSPSFNYKPKFLAEKTKNLDLWSTTILFETDPWHSGLTATCNASISCGSSWVEVLAPLPLPACVPWEKAKDGSGWVADTCLEMWVRFQAQPCHLWAFGELTSTQRLSPSALLSPFQINKIQI